MFDSRNSYRSYTVLNTSNQLLWLCLFALCAALCSWFASVLTLLILASGIVAALLSLRSTFLGATLLLVAMLFSPEIVLSGGARLRAEDLVIPLLVIGVIARICIPRFRFRLRSSPLDLAMLLIITVNCAASIRGVICGYTELVSSVLWNCKLIELFLVYWIAFNYVREPAQIRKLVYILVGVLMAVSAYACWQIPGTAVHTVHRLTAPFEGTPEPTTLGGYMTLVLGIVMAMAIYEKEPRRRGVFWILSSIVVIPILFTLSRTTYVSCIVMVLALAIFTRHRGLLVTSFFGLTLSPFLMPGKVMDRIMMTFDTARLYGLDSSAAERIDVWRKASYALRVNPLLGFGIPQGILDSQFVRTIVETGILGLAAWFVLLLLCGRMAVRVHRTATESLHKAVAVGYLVGLIAVVVHALATITFYIVRIMEPFWFLTGIVASIDAYYRGIQVAGQDSNPVNGIGVRDAPAE